MVNCLWLVSPKKSAHRGNEKLAGFCKVGKTWSTVRRERTLWSVGSESKEFSFLKQTIFLYGSSRTQGFISCYLKKGNLNCHTLDLVITNNCKPTIILILSTLLSMSSLATAWWLFMYFKPNKIYHFFNVPHFSHVLTSPRSPTLIQRSVITTQVRYLSPVLTLPHSLGSNSLG